LNRELMFQVDYVKERVLGPAAQTLANKLDTMYLAAAIQGTANFGRHSRHDPERAEDLQPGARQDRERRRTAGRSRSVDVA
jgi:hypothetical protein